MFGPNSVRISYTGDSRLLGTDGGQATEQLGLRICGWDLSHQQPILRIHYKRFS